MYTFRIAAHIARFPVHIALLATLTIASTASAAPSYNIVPLGFDDPEHVYNEAQQLNQAGQVRGYSQRLTATSFLGYSAWLYDGAQHDSHRPGWQRTYP